MGLGGPDGIVCGLKILDFILHRDRIVNYAAVNRLWGVPGVGFWEQQAGHGLARSPQFASMLTHLSAAHNPYIGFFLDHCHVKA